MATREVFEYSAQFPTILKSEAVTVEAVSVSEAKLPSHDLVIYAALRKVVPQASPADPDSFAIEMHDALTKLGLTIDTVRILRGAGRVVAYRRT